MPKAMWTLELAEDEDQQRPARRAVGPLGRDQGDRLDAEPGEDFSSSAPAYSPLLGVDEEVAAALDGAEVEGEADALRREERDEVADVVDAVGERGEVDGGAELVDRGLERAELEREAAADLERRLRRRA